MAEKSIIFLDLKNSVVCKSFLLKILAFLESELLLSGLLLLCGVRRWFTFTLIKEHFKIIDIDRETVNFLGSC